MANTFALTIGGATKRSKAGSYDVNVDFDGLPAASQQFLIAYGIKQYLADGAAGTTTNEDLKAGVDERLTKMKEGTVKTRTSSGKGPSDNVDVVAKQLATRLIRDKAKAKGVTLTKEKLAELVEKLLNLQGEDFKRQAAEEIEARKARAAEVAEMADDDAFADLFGTDEAEADEG